MCIYTVFVPLELKEIFIKKKKKLGLGCFFSTLFCKQLYRSLSFDLINTGSIM